MNNQKGSILFVAILIVAAISIIAATTTFTRSAGLVKAGRTYRVQVESGQVAHELAVIFANPKICEKLVRISGNSFSVGDIFTVPASGGISKLKSNQNVAVSEMTMKNVASVTVDGIAMQQADFYIYTQDSSDSKNSTIESKVSALYVPVAGGAVSDCRIKVDSVTACAELGFSWNATRAQCGICEKMGGTWNASVCALPGSNAEAVPSSQQVQR